MKKRKGVVDFPVKVVHKANEMTKLLCLKEAAPGILIQFKRLVNNSFPDFLTESLIQLEYEGTEGDFVVVDDDDTLQSAIAQLIGRGQVPKFWASCLEARVSASSQKAAGAAIPQPAKLQSTVESFEDPESRIFGFRPAGQDVKRVPSNLWHELREDCAEVELSMLRSSCQIAGRPYFGL